MENSLYTFQEPNGSKTCKIVAPNTHEALKRLRSQKGAYWAKRMLIKSVTQQKEPVEYTTYQEGKHD